MAKTWVINDPITPIDANTWSTSADQAANAIPKTDFTRAPGNATTGGTATVLTAIVGSFALTDFATVNLRLHADVQSNATLNMNSTGAYPLYTVNGKPVTTGVFKQNSSINVQYNSSLQRWYITGGSANAQSFGTSTGTATALNVATDFILADGAQVAVKLHVNIGNGATLNVNNTGAKGIYTANGMPVLINAAVSGAIVIFTYNATTQQYYAAGLSAITSTTMIDSKNKREWFTGDGVKKVFNFVNGSYLLGINRILHVYVGGAPQYMNSSWMETSTTSITFSEAPPNGLPIEILYIESVFGDHLDYGTF